MEKTKEEDLKRRQDEKRDNLEVHSDSSVDQIFLIANSTMNQTDVSPARTRR